MDREGNTLNDNGTVTLHPCVHENLHRMSQAELMGFTLPRKYGGLNCPNLIYTMATEIVSRADASFMNMFGLQGIAETVNAFASQEIKDEVLPRFSTGEVTGAMVLTEPDAGSDLQAVRLRAHQDEQGNWYLNGVKRFITNGCGEILLTLARSEPHDQRRTRPEPVHFRAVRADQGAAPGEEAGHSRLAHVRTGVRERAGAAGRRTAARPDHVRAGPDERRARRDRRPVAGDRRSGVSAWLAPTLTRGTSSAERSRRCRPWPKW